MSSGKPIVSVIIPTFNRSGMVREAVESVVSQTCGEFELIVVDDGSTDDTVAALKPYSASLRLVRQENRGVSAARNSGAAVAGGELLAFLDSDDLWLPEKLAVQLSYLRTFPEAAVCHTEELWIRNGRRVNPRKKHAKAEGRAFMRLLRESLISPSSVILRRSVFDEAGGFDESLPACEDYALWLALARRHDVHLIRRPLVVKRGGHHDQLTRTIWGLDRFRVRVLHSLAANGGLSAEEAGEVRAVLEEKCRILAEGSRRRGREEEAEGYLELAREAAP
jgi:glycosyltransferase involved in cell wall biosynthesis